MKIIRSDQVSELIHDGDTIMYTGITLGGFAEEALIELEKSFLETGETEVWPMQPMRAF